MELKDIIPGHIVNVEVPNIDGFEIKEFICLKIEETGYKGDTSTFVDVLPIGKGLKYTETYISGHVISTKVDYDNLKSYLKLVDKSIPKIGKTVMLRNDMHFTHIEYTKLKFKILEVVNQQDDEDYKAPQLLKVRPTKHWNREVITLSSDFFYVSNPHC